MKKWKKDEENKKTNGLVEEFGLPDTNTVMGTKNNNYNNYEDSNFNENNKGFSFSSPDPNSSTSGSPSTGGYDPDAQLSGGKAPSF